MKIPSAGGWSRLNRKIKLCWARPRQCAVSLPLRPGSECHHTGTTNSVELVKSERVQAWIVAFLPEGTQTGLFFWYIVISLLIVLVLLRDYGDNVVAIAATGVLMVAAIIFPLRRSKREPATRSDDDPVRKVNLGRTTYDGIFMSGGRE